MIKRVFIKPDGSVRIAHACMKGKPEGMSDRDWAVEQFERIIQADASLQGLPFSDVDESELPQDREFRDQWRMKAGKVAVDPILETEERWKRIRAERNRLLDESDKALARAMDLNENVAALKAYRQALRDITEQPNPKNISWPKKPN